ncbi:MAG: hypothetical protein IJD81_01490 [Oscillospiraceae bacterium]|nr:hypothetical protein [Oscillospiraceae bacterium]
MDSIKIRIFHTGTVCVSPALPFGGNEKNPLKASPIFTKKSDRIRLPVSSYLIQHPKGKILFDCGWHRDMIPSGVCEDKVAQRKSLAWIREQSMSENCLASLANHDADVIPHEILI